MRLLFWFGALCMISPGFAGSWYVHWGLGLGNQITYNSIAEREFCNKVHDVFVDSLQPIEKNALDAMLQKLSDIYSLGEMVNQNSNSDVDFAEKNCKEQIQEWLQTNSFTDPNVQTFYETAQHIQTCKKQLEKDDHTLYPYRKSLLGLLQAGVGYSISPYISGELTGLLLKSGIVAVESEEQQISYQELVGNSKQAEYTRLKGGIATFKGCIPISWLMFGLNIYGTFGGALLSGTRDRVEFLSTQKTDKRIPWSVVCTVGGGMQFNLCKKWRLNLSLMHIIGQNHIPSVNYVTLNFHRII